MSGRGDEAAEIIQVARNDCCCFVMNGNGHNYRVHHITCFGERQQPSRLVRAGFR